MSRSNDFRTMQGDIYKKPSKLDTFISATEAAKLAGIERDTFTAYVSRGFAPEPVGTFGGRRVYDRATVEAWAAKRAGSGDT